MDDSPFTFAFDCGRDPEHLRLGGKCSSLSRLTAIGAPVPPGFAVTTDAFSKAVDPRVQKQISVLLTGVDAANPDQVDVVSARIREAIVNEPVPDIVRFAVQRAHETLMEQCGADVPVAVRSSATAEDLPDASFAGQQDTYLSILGFDEVIHRIRDCWASLYTTRAITYRLAHGVPNEGLSMAVAVQKMVDARAAGVAMTLDPKNGDRSKIVVDSSWGVGELVVSGEVTPDNFMLDKVMLSVIRRTLSDKTCELVTVPGSTRLTRRDVDIERRRAPSVNEAELLGVARLAKAAERHYGCPQDVEWAVDRDLPTDSNVVLLQSRPETVWSRRPERAPLTNKDAGIASITRTLLSQVGQR
jgi:pyruvate, water dikinase